MITYLDVCGIASPIVFRPEPAPERDHRVDGSPLVLCGLVLCGFYSG
jgi:hypothetical protein